MKSLRVLQLVSIALFRREACAYSTTSPPQTRTQPTPISSLRRSILALPFLTAFAAVPSMAQALDMDAFAQSELKTQQDPKKMSDDEALCRFGQPSRATGEACQRAGITKKTTKSGVDAYGQVNRGDFVRCKPKYVDNPIKGLGLVKEWDCK